MFFFLYFNLMHLTHNREYCNAVSSVCLSSSSVTNNFYQFGLLDFYHIQVSKAYNFCKSYNSAKLIRTTIGQFLKGNKIAP